MGLVLWKVINIDHQLQRTSDMRLVIESTKTNAGTRKLPMTEDVAQCFRTIIEDREEAKCERVVDGYAGFLFTDKNGYPEVAMHWEHRFNHMVKRYNDIYRVQIPNITPHVCRHTYCSNMAKSGMNPKTLQYLMGHSDSEWLFNRLKEEYVLVRNHQIGRINLSPDVVDGIVFWTKNPVSMLSRLSELDRYNYYFQFILNAYDRDVEPNILSKNNIIIPAFQKLSQVIGREKVIWRYDPIFFNDRYVAYEVAINSIAMRNALVKSGISFIDLPGNVFCPLWELCYKIYTQNNASELIR